MSGAIAVDLGSSVTRVADSTGRMLFEEESLAAIDLSTGRLIAFGTEAAGLGASSAGRVRLQRPVRSGKLVDVDLAEVVLEELFHRVGIGRLGHPDVAVCAHVDMSDVQRRAIERAIRKTGLRHVSFIEQPIATAIGAGLAIAEPRASMVVAVGGGTTDVGLMALGALVTGTTVSIGGMDLDEAVRVHLARTHGINLDRRAAESLRRSVGTLARGAHLPVDVVGRDVQSGRPTRVVIDPAELTVVLARTLEPVLDAAVRCLTGAPPDLANDLIDSGLVLAGGGALLPGLDQAVARATGVPVHVPDEGARLAVRGAARSASAAQYATSSFSPSRLD